MRPAGVKTVDHVTQIRLLDTMLNAKMTASLGVVALIAGREAATWQVDGYLAIAGHQLDVPGVFSNRSDMTHGLA